MGCERSERREPDMASMHFRRKFSSTLKPKQPHPNPPLLTQGRERIMASIKLYRFVTQLDKHRAIYRGALKICMAMLEFGFASLQPTQPSREKRLERREDAFDAGVVYIQMRHQP